MKTKVISGNFVANISGDIGSGSVGEGDSAMPASQAITEAGVTYIVQRDGLSKVYKDLAAKGEKRNSVAFSAENASKFRDSLEKALAPYGDFTVAVDQHEPGEGAASPMVRASAFVDSLLDNGDKETQLRATLALFDPAAADADREGLVAIAHKQGLGIQPPKAAKASA